MKKLQFKKPVLSKQAIRPDTKPEPKEPKREKNTLPTDEYRDEVKPSTLKIDDSRKIVCSIKRGGDLGLLTVDVRQYVTTDVYTGYTKKGITIPFELLDELIGRLVELQNKAEDKGLTE